MRSDFLDVRQRFESAHARHHDVHEHDLGLACANRGNRLLTVFRNIDHEATRRKDTLETAAQARLVVDDEHANRFPGRSHSLLPADAATVIEIAPPLGCCTTP